jgi:hypothetical protein
MTVYKDVCPMKVKMYNSLECDQRTRFQEMLEKIDILESAGMKIYGAKGAKALSTVGANYLEEFILGHFFCNTAFIPVLRSLFLYGLTRIQFRQDKVVLPEFGVPKNFRNMKLCLSIILDCDFPHLGFISFSSGSPLT